MSGGRGQMTAILRTKHKARRTTFTLSPFPFRHLLTHSDAQVGRLYCTSQTQ